MWQAVVLASSPPMHHGRMDGRTDGERDTPTPPTPLLQKPSLLAMAMAMAIPMSSIAASLPPHPALPCPCPDGLPATHTCDSEEGGRKGLAMMGPFTLSFVFVETIKPKAPESHQWLL